MYIATVCGNIQICARCGTVSELTKDHFIPQSCYMTVNEAGNYVGLCAKCNSEKANRVVLPSWYTYLDENQKNNLNRYMRYCRSWILNNCTNPAVLSYVKKL